MEIVLIPGVNPGSAKKIFDLVKENLPKQKFIELSAASEEELLAKKPKGKFILVGKSMGGRIVLEYQLAHKDSAALVLLAPYIEADKKLGAINVPTLILHGTIDPIISVDNSRKLAKILPNCKLIEIEGADHSFRGKEQVVAKHIAEFINCFS